MVSRKTRPLMCLGDGDDHVAREGELERRRQAHAVAGRDCRAGQRLEQADLKA
jgi:hypothetical protein